jgi:diketogulonate reductase-like aldo/keto reductase
VKDPLEHPTLIELAAVRGKTPAQITLRWHLGRGRAAIPNSVRPERIAEKIDVFDFTLRDDELAAIDRMDTGVRAGADPEVASAQTL